MNHARSKDLRLPRLPASEDGSVTIEFAFVAPILVILCLGVVEATNMLSQDRTVALANETMVDYVARLKTVAATDQTTVGQALDLMMSPYGSSYKSSIAIASFDANGNLNAGPSQFSVHGSGYCFTTAEITTDACPPGSTPACLSAGSDSMVIGKTTSLYQPILLPTFMPHNFSLGGLNMQRPREKQLTSSVTTCS